MSPTLIDSNVILDIVTEDPRWYAWSSQAMADAIDSAELVINPLIYAEISVGFERIEEIELALPPDLIRREPLPWEAAFLAGKSFLAYRRRGGTKSAPLPDFYIGAHAAVRQYRLLTRDAGRFSTYFPTVELICPS